MRVIAAVVLGALAVACAPVAHLSEPEPQPQAPPLGVLTGEVEATGLSEPLVLSAGVTPRPGPTTPPALVTPEPSVSPPPVTLALAGDVHGEGAIAATLAEGGNPLASVSSLLSDADLAMVNLETAVALQGTPADKVFTFMADPRLLTALTESGVDVVSLANNHSLDYGVGALLETRARALEAGLVPIGAGTDDAEAYGAAVMEVANRTVAFVGLSRVLPLVSWKATADGPGIASAYEEEPALAAVRSAAAMADHVVVSIHWGEELAACPNEAQLRLASLLVAAGADVVAGHHPHVLQGIAQLEGAVVAYSLGNFLFSARALETRRTGVLRLALTDSGPTDLKLRPVLIGANSEPAPAAGPEAEAILDLVAARSPGGASGCSFGS